MEKVATLQEIETHYSITDLMDLHEALDEKNKIENEIIKRGR